MVEISHDLRLRLQQLEYPPNHQYDPQTLLPLGLLQNRLQWLRRVAPEMFCPPSDSSFLDVGSNKGFMCLYLSQTYAKLTGIDHSAEHIALSRDIRDAWGFQNVQFKTVDCTNLPKNFYEPADVVYAGHLNHHLYGHALKAGLNPFAYIRAVACLALSIFVLDGPLDLDDPTSCDVAAQGDWPVNVRDSFSLEGHARALEPEFDFVRAGPSGTGKRLIAVFKRRHI